MVTEEDLILGNGHTMQYLDDVLQNCTSKAYIISLTNVTPIKINKENLRVFKTAPYGRMLSLLTDEETEVLCSS